MQKRDYVVLQYEENDVTGTLGYNTCRLASAARWRMTEYEHTCMAQRAHVKNEVPSCLSHERRSNLRHGETCSLATYSATHVYLFVSGLSCFVIACLCMHCIATRRCPRKTVLEQVKHGVYVRFS